MKNIAVIMPFKNSKDTVKRSVLSVLNSVIDPGHELLLICVNDLSTDGSFDIVSDVIKDYPGKAFVLESVGTGPANARNTALNYIRNSHAIIDCIAFCDSDDYWDINHLSRSVYVLYNLGHRDMVYSNVRVENEFGNPLVVYGTANPVEFDVDELNKGNYIYISTVVMRRDCIDVGDFDTASVPMEDWQYWLRISDKYIINKIHGIPDVIYTWKSTGSYYSDEDSRMAKMRISKDRIRQNDVNDPMTVEGWLSKEEGEFLAKNAIGRKCIEIGSYKGKSTCFIARTAESLVCIDTFKADNGGQTQNIAPTTYVDFANNTAHLKNVTPLIGMSQDVHPLLKNDEFDFIFIDGMHDYDSVFNDVKNYLPKLKDGAVIMFHDYFERDWPGVVLCVNTLFGGPTELVDTIAKVTITPDIRFKLAVFFAGMMIGKSIIGPDLTTVDELVEPDDVPEQGCFAGKKVIIAPWSAKMPDGRNNAKNYPYWSEVIHKLHFLGVSTVQIGRVGEDVIGCKSVFFNKSDDDLRKLLDECDTFISVDSFFPHFAAYHRKKGLVIFGKSDPEIFGHSLHVNILKSRTYLRPDQFRWWNDVEYDIDCFMYDNEVVKEIIKLLETV